MLPESDFSGAVMISYSRFEADVQVELILRTVLRPRHLLKPVRFCVDELRVLRDGFIRVSEGRETDRETV